MVEKEQPSTGKAKLLTKMEEEALAKTWVSTSQSPIIGNNQTGKGFWKEVLSKFLAIMEQGHYRDIDSVSSRWRKMHPVVNRFSGIYNNLYTGRRSVMSDEDVFKEAMRRYEDTHGTGFPTYVLGKFCEPVTSRAPVSNEVATAKRTKTSETGSYSAGDGSDAR